ncbi:hypothetical protein RJT34_21543 [Clitoria ternatea]|uniref:Uncharacterized protein n=1 Tax=Clitoria ternatea TaxID=43366 RepID=A0AAN9P5S3_CLITE
MLTTTKVYAFLFSIFTSKLVLRNRTLNSAIKFLPSNLIVDSCHPNSVTWNVVDQKLNCAPHWNVSYLGRCIVVESYVVVKLFFVSGFVFL